MSWVSSPTQPLHVGEVERRGADIAAVAVHIGARIAALATHGEIWVSPTVREILAGSKIQLTDRGVHDLKGLPEPWRLFAVGDGNGA